MRRAVAGAALGLALALAAFLGTAPAGAHSDTGNLGLDVVVRAGSPAEVQVALSYTSDGHPAEAATVTVSGAGPDGATTGPVTLTAIGLGGYRGELALPGAGTWTVRAESVEPVASAETKVEVSVSSGPDTPDPDDTTPGDPPGDDGGGGDGSGSDLMPWIAAGIVVAAVAGGGVLLLQRRRR